MFPALIGGNAFTNCTSLQAGAPEQCQASVTTGTWLCKGTVQRIGSGSDGSPLYESLPASARTMCSLQTATGAWKPCAPLVSQAGQGDVVIGIPTGEGSAGSPASVSDTPVIIAQNGSQCLLPLAYNGLTVG